MAKDDDSGFPKKWEKHLPTGWKDSAESMSDDELENIIVESQKTMSDVEKDMDADERLQALKAEVKDIAGSYKDLISMHQAKARYSVYLLRTRGKV